MCIQTTEYSRILTTPILLRRSLGQHYRDRRNEGKDNGGELQEGNGGEVNGIEGR